MKNENESLLKISELAKAAGVSITTAKYYVKEGLVDIACKTGRNMAYYAPESVERVRLIKELQSEKYYPLSVIKRLLRTGNMDIREMELMDAIHKADQWDYYESIPVSEAAKEAGIRPAEAEALIRAGIVRPVRKGKKRYCCKGDCRVMKLVKRRLEAGLALNETIKTFLAYETHIQIASRADIDSLVSDSLLARPLDTPDIIRMIHVNDDTLDDFIAIKRYSYNAALGSAYIERVERKLASLGLYASAICGAFARTGYKAQADFGSRALGGGESGDSALTLFSTLTHMSSKGIAQTLSVCHKANEAYKNPFPPSEDKAMDLLREALRLGWRYIVAREFGTVDAEAELGTIRAMAADRDLLQDVLKLLEEAYHNE